MTIPSKRHPVRFLRARLASRRLVPLAVVLLGLLGLLLLRGLALQGWIRPVRVAGNSMAPALRGPHYPVQCLDCRFPFYCAAEFLPADLVAVCPNCGFPDNPVDPQRMVAGRRVLIDRWARRVSGLRAWQAVAFSTSADEPGLTVKRIVAAGPGELTIRAGDVYVDGQIRRKTLEQLRQLRILVHDDRYRPTRDPSLPPRWRARRADTRWRVTDAGYHRSESEDGVRTDVDWLEYTQWICWKAGSRAEDRTRPVPIPDHYACNQNLSRGPLNPVTDIMVSCELTCAGTGALRIRLSDGREPFELAMRPGCGTLQLLRDSRPVWALRRRFTQPWHVELALCDQQVLASVNGTSILRYSYQPSGPNARADPPVAVLAIGADGLAVDCRPPRVYRDIHYLGPGGLSIWSAPERISPHAQFVLGDNVPASIDSRQFSFLDPRVILGPVIPISW